MLIQDFLLTLKHLAFLPCAFLPSKSSDPEFRELYSELANVRGTLNKIKLMREIALGSEYKRQTIIWHKPGVQDADWYFLNGICTTPEIAELNLEAISDLFGTKVTALYNPTAGFVPDILECIYERTLDKYAPVTLDVFDKIQKSLDAGKKVRLIAHSQGGIIASNLLKKFQALGKPVDLELFTFASAADEDVVVPGVYQEHFCNEWDFVARIGMLNESTSGNRYTLEKTPGHFLNRDYLEHFKDAKYCNGTSRLYSYLK